MHMHSTHDSSTIIVQCSVTDSEMTKKPYRTHFAAADVVLETSLLNQPKNRRAYKLYCLVAEAPPGWPEDRVVRAGLMHTSTHGGAETPLGLIELTG